MCVLANDLTGAARGGTGFDSCVLAGIEGNEFVVVSQIEPPVQTEKHQRTEVRSRRPVTSQRRRSRSSRWVQLSRRVNLKWIRRDGSLTFNIRGRGKVVPPRGDPGLGKLVVIQWCAGGPRAGLGHRSSCFDSLRAIDPRKMTGRHDRPRIRCDQRALASTLLANLSTRLPHQMVSARRAFPSKPASLGGNRLILLWFGPRLSVSPVEPVIGP